MQFSLWVDPRRSIRLCSVIYTTEPVYVSVFEAFAEEPLTSGQYKFYSRETLYNNSGQEYGFTEKEWRDAGFLLCGKISIDMDSEFASKDLRAGGISLLRDAQIEAAAPQPEVEANDAFGVLVTHLRRFARVIAPLPQLTLFNHPLPPGRYQWESP